MIISKSKIRDIKFGKAVKIVEPVSIYKCDIGAGSVVTKNINIKGIYAGNPVKLIRKL